MMYLPVAQEASLGRSFPSLSLGANMESASLASISPRHVSGVSPRRAGISPRHVASVSPRHVLSVTEESACQVANERRLSSYLKEEMKPGSNSSASTTCTRPGSNSSGSNASTTDEYSNISEDTGSTRECLQSVAVTASSSARQVEAAVKLECFTSETQDEKAAHCHDASKWLLSAAVVVAPSPRQATDKFESSSRRAQDENAHDCHDKRLLEPLVPGFVSARVRQHEDLISLSLGAKAPSFTVQ